MTAGRGVLCATRHPAVTNGRLWDGRGGGAGAEPVRGIKFSQVLLGGAAREIVLDNGPEPTGKAFDRWASERGVRLRFIDPGKPVPSAFVEGFHGRLRDEGLDRHRFLGLADARRTVEARRRDDDRARPHRSLGDRTPEDVRREFDGTAVGWQGPTVRPPPRR